MAPKKLGPCGGTGESTYDMDVTGITSIVKIGVRHGAAVDALAVQFLRNGKEERMQWGGPGGQLTDFTFKPSEYITAVKGYIGAYDGDCLVTSIKFDTNMGSYGPYGPEKGFPFELSAVDGQIIGFFGRSRNVLYSLGVYVNKISYQTPSPVDKLLIGFQQFKTEEYDKKPHIFEPLKTGQKPKYMLFACCDSRVSPSVTLGLQPGEAFIVRNIANMVPPFDKTRYTGEGSALEYGVHHLHVENIVVLGHSKCGGISALMSYKFDGTDHTFYCGLGEDRLCAYAARKKVQAEHGSKSFDEQCAICEKEAIKLSLENLKTYPFVKESLQKGTLKLFGAHYDFVNGRIEILK